MTSTMNRIVHDAVRRDLERFTSALATFPDADHRRAARLAEAWEFFHTMLTLHHQGEDRIFFPTFAELEADPELLVELEDEHHEMRVTRVLSVRRWPCSTR